MPGTIAIFLLSLSSAQTAYTLPEISKAVGSEPAVVLLKSGKGFKGHIRVEPNGQSLRHLRLGKDPEYACADIQSIAVEKTGRRVKRNLARWGLGIGMFFAAIAVAVYGEEPATRGASVMALAAPFVGYFGGAGLVPEQLNAFTPSCAATPKTDGPKP